MRIFLIDKDKQYLYNDLLHKINQAQSYYPLLKTNSLFDLFSNIIIALLYNKPLMLLDSDLNQDEVEGVDEKMINISQGLPTSMTYSSMGDVIEKIQMSDSELTIFTSGTTGQPKKVIHSIATLARSVKVGDRYEDQVWAFAYNPTHMAGLQVFFQAFENLNTLVNLFKFSRVDIYDAIEKYRITHISATPTFYRLLLPFEKDYENILRVTFGGEKSDEKLYNSILRIFPNAKLNNIYASTEAGSLFVSKGEFFQIPVSLMDKIKVENDELLIHKSLLGISDSFEFSGDYYKTGDLIEWMNKEVGYFRFKSRKNELINVGGYKVNPGEVENFISQIPGIQQVLVYGKTNSVLGNILCAEIKLEKNGVVSDLNVRQYLNDKLQDFKIPRIIKFVESFSMTRTGKIKRL